MTDYTIPQHGYYHVGVYRIWGCFHPGSTPGFVPAREHQQWIKQRQMDRWLSGWRIPA